MTRIRRSMCSATFTGGGNSEGKHQRPAEPLRAAELHFADSRQSHHQVWRARARHPRHELLPPAGFNGTFTFSSLNTAADVPPGSNRAIGAIQPAPSTPCPISYQYAEQQLTTWRRNSLRDTTLVHHRPTYTLPSPTTTSSSTYRTTGGCGPTSRSATDCASRPRTRFTIMATGRRAWASPGESAAGALRRK